jgi:hypothetical protein
VKKFLLSCFILIFFLSSFIIFSPKVCAQASVNVPTSDPVYRDIDKLVGHGLIDIIIVGQRPYSRKEIARLTAEAMKNLSRFDEPLTDPALSEKKKDSIRKRKDYVEEILKRLERDYHEELVALGALEGDKIWYSAHPVEKVDVDLTFAASPARVLNNDNGLGKIDAVINPLLQNREGRHLVEGSNLSLESAHWVRVTNYLAFYAKPRFQLAVPADDQPNDNNVYLQNLYGKFNVKNLQIEVGRDNLVWGQGENAGILLSNNPRALDMAEISNDSPFILPWVFKYLGAHKLSFFYADLGPEQNFPNAFLAGYKWSLEPLSFFELGFSLIVQEGGEGSPPASFGTRVKSLFGFNPETAGQDVSNKLGGIDMRFRIPPARGLELYGEAMFDDRHNSFFSHAQLVDDASYVAGVYLPRLVNTGKLDLRLEYHKTGDRFYRHPDFISGVTLNRFILGDNLGPDAYGIYLTTNWDIDPRNLFTFEEAFESRSNDIWAVGDPNAFSFVKVQDNPDERRYRTSATWLHRFDPFPLLVKMQAAYERVENFNFVLGDSKNNFLGELFFQFNFDRWTHFPK